MLADIIRWLWGGLRLNSWMLTVSVTTPVPLTLHSRPNHLSWISLPTREVTHPRCLYRPYLRTSEPPWLTFYSRKRRRNNHLTVAGYLLRRMNASCQKSHTQRFPGTSATTLWRRPNSLLGNWGWRRRVQRAGTARWTSTREVKYNKTRLQKVILCLINYFYDCND